MEIQNFIDNTNDYIQKFKDNNLIVKKYTNYKLILVKYKHNVEYDFNLFPWIIYCKGLIINTNNNKIVCLPPIKSKIENNIEINANLISGPENNTEFIYQPLIDGTMINVFNHNDEWFISTRSNIGAKNKFLNEVSFKDMFLECFDNFNELNKNHSYSFVLQHINNRIITKYNSSKITLVEEYDFNNNNINVINLQQHNYSFDVIQNLNQDNILYLNNYFVYPQNFQYKGYTIKNNNNNLRYNIINSYYNIALQLKGNFNNKFLHFINLYRINKLYEYIQFFPEDNNLYISYKNKLNQIVSTIYNNYVKFNIEKSILLNDIPFQNKPVVKELHNIYLQTHNSIRFNTVLKYFINLPPKRIIFIHNYYI